ncbi:hypothetical protein JCM33374_g3741 [Metschnikowia sp. JCM 33374]|nr:hypothetical protein JCM33374_g3741 [Metschnikowia sp. JCM 33374]
MSCTKPKVLKIGTWEEPQPYWTELEKIADVVVCESATRAEFIQDLKTKYSDITSIVRTYYSFDSTGRFDAELAACLPPTLRSISQNTAGYDQIDVQPLTDRGIQVSNITTPVEAPTALTAVYLTLAAMRNFQHGHDLLVQGKWCTARCAGVPLGSDPEGKVVGIIGMGSIGRATRDRLQPFGFEKFVYYNRTQLSPELEKGCEYVSFDKLVATADVILLCMPLNANTYHLIDSEVLANMKKGVIIVNIARGAVIDEVAITKALEAGHVGAFGSDVFEHEPQLTPGLIEMPNVVSLPHMGSYSCTGSH